jgi:RNA polymerase sigma-70 factor (ECF subfamily)
VHGAPGNEHLRDTRRLLKSDRFSLLTAAAAGDAVAFDRLVGPLVETGYRLAVSMLGAADAEDAVQEATIKAWRSLHRLQDERTVRAWFLTIVANQCRSVRRGRWWSLVRLAEPRAQGAQPGPEEEAIRRSDLSRALAGLDRDDRTALFLRYGLDLPLAETAAVLGISETAARSRIVRAAQRLRPALEGR